MQEKKKQLFFVGTVHSFTKNKELASLISKINPDKILVEIKQSDLKRRKITSYPPEMQFVYAFARKKKIPVAGFDVPAVLFDIKRKKEIAKLVESQIKIVRKYSWKKFNEKKSAQKIMNAILPVVLIKNWKARQKTMAANIRKHAYKKEPLS